MWSAASGPVVVPITVRAAELGVDQDVLVTLAWLPG